MSHDDISRTRSRSHGQSQKCGPVYYIQFYVGTTHDIHLILVDQYHLRRAHRRQLKCHLSPDGTDTDHQTMTCRQTIRWYELPLAQISVAEVK
jgi:hypothetical protein